VLSHLPFTSEEVEIRVRGGDGQCRTLREGGARKVEREPRGAHEASVEVDSVEGELESAVAELQLMTVVLQSTTEELQSMTVVLESAEEGAARRCCGGPVE
jgi:hypothetical protein